MTKRNLWLAAGAIGAGLLLWLKRDRKRPAAVPSLETSGPRVVVLGAGFAGLTAARKLADRLKGRAHILLIDRHNYHSELSYPFTIATMATASPWAVRPVS